MAVTILDTIKSAANAGNTAYIVILSLLCDTYSDLPTQYSLTGYELAQGCKAHVIDTNTDYMLDSSGNWHISGGEIWQNVYTKTETDTLLADKQDTLTTAQLDAVNSGITSEKLTADEAAIVELVDDGAKNTLKNIADSTGIVTVNADGTMLLNGTASSNISLTLGASNYKLESGNYVISSTNRIPENIFLSIRVVSGGTTYTVTGGNDNVKFTVSEDTVVSRVYLYVTSGTQANNLVIKPMICTEAAWGISHKFVPYCPSMQEMYQMILALQ